MVVEAAVDVCRLNDSILRMKEEEERKRKKKGNKKTNTYTAMLYKMMATEHGYTRVRVYLSGCVCMGLFVCLSKGCMYS